MAVEGEGGVVAGAGGGALALVGAEPVAPAVMVDAGVPLALLLAPADANVLRRAVPLRALVAGVLALRAEAEVVLHVGQAVVVDVIDDEAGRGVHDDAVHADLPLALGADRVEGVRLPRGAPFVPGELGVVLRIDAGEPALRQRDPAVGVARDQPAGPQQDRREARFEKDLDGKAQLADGPALSRAGRGGRAGIHGAGAGAGPATRGRRPAGGENGPSIKGRSGTNFAKNPCPETGAPAVSACSERNKKNWRDRRFRFSIVARI